MLSVHTAGAVADQEELGRLPEAGAAAVAYGDNVIYPLSLAHMNRKESRERGIAALKRVGLGNFTNHYPHQLWGSMQQRVAVAGAMVTEPQLLLLDEPFAALDAQMREILQVGVIALLESSTFSGMLVTHKIDEAILFGDRVVVLSGRPETTVVA